MLTNQARPDLARINGGLEETSSFRLGKLETLHPRQTNTIHVDEPHGQEVRTRHREHEKAATLQVTQAPPTGMDFVPA